ncbi:hypothetical protein FB45DRAFT_1010439, partial [Roridomyces roridus]
MHFTSLTKIGLLSLVAQSHAAPWLTGTDDSFGFVQSLSTAFTRLLGVGPKTPVTVGTFVPSSDNLIIVPPTFEGQGGSLGWTFPVSEGSQVGRNVVDGFSKDISVMLTSPGEDEEFLMGMSIGPQHGLCGFTPGETARGFIRPSVVGNQMDRQIWPKHPARCPRRSSYRMRARAVQFYDCRIRAFLGGPSSVGL